MKNLSRSGAIAEIFDDHDDATWKPPRNYYPRAAHPEGHFYSPICNPLRLEEDTDRIWPSLPSVHGIDFHDDNHLQVLRGILPRYTAEFDYPLEAMSADRFYLGNSQFSWLDAPVLFALLRHWRPRRLVEVGGGFSSMLIADVNRRFLDGRIAYRCVEPYPSATLRRGLDGMTELLRCRVEDVPLTTFDQLQSGDVLFIDSSHVCKTGSDVNHLLLQVLPRLNSGVRIHFHDIFLPLDYPKEWAIEENRSWNEQYLLQALLMHSDAFEVLFGCTYASCRFPNLVAWALDIPRHSVHGGGSFWIEKRV